MKLHVLSDVHLEFQKCRNQSSLGCIDCDVHVLAGDIGVGLAVIEWALHNFSKPVIYVCWHHREEPVRFTAHCLAGISRSAGVALSVFDYTRASFPRITMAGRANGLVIQRLNRALGLAGY